MPQQGGALAGCVALSYLNGCGKSGRALGIDGIRFPLASPRSTLAPIATGSPPGLKPGPALRLFSKRRGPIPAGKFGRFSAQGAPAARIAPPKNLSAKKLKNWKAITAPRCSVGCLPSSLHLNSDMIVGRDLVGRWGSLIGAACAPLQPWFWERAMCEPRMQYPLRRADLYQKVSAECADYANTASSLYLSTYYQRRAEENRVRAEGELKGLEREPVPLFERAESCRACRPSVQSRR